MESPSELAQLRDRVNRLEATVAELQRRTNDLAGAPSPAIATGSVAFNHAPAVAPGAVADATLPPPLPTTEPDFSAPPAPPAAPRPSHAPRRPEMSSTVWIAAAGGVLFLLGAIYGLTLSIQRGWISPPVRVGMGIVTGLGLGVVSARLMLADSRRLGVSLLIAALGTFVFAIHFGAMRAHLFPPLLGLAGTAAATLFAGGLAARVRSGGAMAVAAVLGVLAPLIYSTGQAQMIPLFGYYVGALIAQAAAYYVSGTGATWRLARWLGVVPVALLAIMATSAARTGDQLTVLGLVVAAYAVSLIIVWLPAHPERPRSTWSLTATLNLALTGALWAFWERSDWTPELFSLPLLLQATLVVALVPLARRRLGDGSADLGLVLIAAAYLIVTVPVGFDARWVGLAWSAMALASAGVAWAAARAERTEATALWLAAFAATGAASLRWLLEVGTALPPDALPFLSPSFVSAVLSAAAWSLLALARTDGLRTLAAVLAQLVFVNAIAFEWMGRRPVTEWDEFSLATLMATLTYALAGIGQWYAGMHRADTALGRPLRIAGYGWLAVAALKLLFGDLAQASTGWKAVATLGIGALLIVAALLANRLRSRPSENA